MWRKLGFTVAFTYGELPFHGQVFLDGARLDLRQLNEPAIRPELQEREYLLSASITVDVAEPLFLALEARGVIFHQAPQTDRGRPALLSFVTLTGTSFILQVHRHTRGSAA